MGTNILIFIWLSVQADLDFNRDIVSLLIY